MEKDKKKSHSAKKKLYYKHGKTMLRLNYGFGLQKRSEK